MTIDLLENIDRLLAGFFCPILFLWETISYQPQFFL